MSDVPDADRSDPPGPDDAAPQVRPSESGIDENTEPGRSRPFTSDEINEDAPAPRGRRPYTEREHQRHEDYTRRNIAYSLLGILAVVVAVGCVVWIRSDLRSIQSFGIVLTPVVTLTGTVLGFYFSRSGRSS